MSGSLVKYKRGKSGAYTKEYHELLGKTPWIVVKRLLRNSYPASNTLDQSGNLIAVADTASPSASSQRCNTEELSEGDIATVFSQFGEVTDVRFARNRKNGKFLGTAFVKFLDYRSGIVAADEMNSNVEENDLVVLSVGDTSHTTGIVVERCEEVLIPAMNDASQELYSQWVQRSQATL